MCERHPLGCSQDRTPWAGDPFPGAAAAGREHGPLRRRDISAPSGAPGRGVEPAAAAPAGPRRRVVVWDETQRAVDETLGELDGYLSGAPDAAPRRKDPYGLAPYLSRRWSPSDRERAGVPAGADLVIPPEYWRTIGA